MVKNEPTDQREKLKQSEKAARSQPENFKDRETEDKVVEIGPITPGDDAIKGIDPTAEPRTGRN